MANHNPYKPEIFSDEEFARHELEVKAIDESIRGWKSVFAIAPLAFVLFGLLFLINIKLFQLGCSVSVFALMTCILYWKISVAARVACKSCYRRIISVRNQIYVPSYEELFAAYVSQSPNTPVRAYLLFCISWSTLIVKCVYESIRGFSTQKLSNGGRVNREDGTL